MELGMIGLGRMGANMSLRLQRAGHKVVGYARTATTVQKNLADGSISEGATSLADMVKKLPQPRILWMMVPAASVDATLDQLLPIIDKGDIVIDGGNSYYIDDIRRATELEPKGIHYLDVGTSGGVWGLDRGYCLMIGGEEETVKYLDPIFAALAPGEGGASPTPGRDKVPGTAQYGYLRCGKHGAGHFVKMVHNGIEYGLMAAYAEGLNVLANANVGLAEQVHDAETAPLRDPKYYRYELDLPAVAEVWRRGSVIASWLLDLTAHALSVSPDLSDLAGRVSDSGEGRWTVLAAVEEGVPADVLSAALFARFGSRGNAGFADRVLSAMRREFGGHQEKAEGSR